MASRRVSLSLNGNIAGTLTGHQVQHVSPIKLMAAPHAAHTPPQLPHIVVKESPASSSRKACSPILFQLSYSHFFFSLTSQMQQAAVQHTTIVAFTLIKTHSANDRHRHHLLSTPNRLLLADRLANEPLPHPRLALPSARPKSMLMTTVRSVKLFCEHQPLLLVDFETGEGGMRQDSSLLKLTRKFLDLRPEDEDAPIVNLNDASTLLGVQKRRLYDITNVLEGISVIEKVRLFINILHLLACYI